MLGVLEYTWPLYGLPLIAIPVLIHLFNRLRHRKLNWAAMMFLRQASRKSTRYARLRQWLVLLFRVLAVLALILMLCQPKMGGMATSVFGSRPDVIVLVIDRSASMEAAGPKALQSKREYALQELLKQARDKAAGSRLMVMDHMAERPTELKPVDSLLDLPRVKATDTSADMLAVMQRLHDWIEETTPGSCEVWIASDLQASNWSPDNEELWKAVTDDLKAKDNELVVRVVTLKENTRENYALVVEDVAYRKKGSQGELDLTVRIERNNTNEITLPLEVRMGSAQREEWEVRMPSGRQPVRHTMTIEVDAGADVGWGSVAVARGGQGAKGADGNIRDDAGYFVYGQTKLIQSAIVGLDEQARTFLGIAAAPPGLTNLTSRIYKPEEREGLELMENGMVIWQDVLPEGDTAAAIEDYVRDGGVVLFFPPGEPDQLELEGKTVGWGKVDTAAQGNKEGFVVDKWDIKEGPLANTDQGLSLPVLEMQTWKRQRIIGGGIILASFSDEEPFLIRHGLGEGQILFCATLPHDDWSTLNEGMVLLPMVQRLLGIGAIRYGKAQLLSSGEDTLGESNDWKSVGDGDARSFATEAGLFRKTDGRLVAVNRPAKESDQRMLAFEQIKKQFGAIEVFEVKGEELVGQRMAKLWQLMLVFMAIFLLVEARLIMPRSTDEGAEIRVSKTPDKAAV